MYRTDAVDELVYRKRWRGAALCLIVLCCWLLGSLPVYAQSQPGGDVSDPATRGADIARPAVVRIITTITGRVTVHFPPTTDITFPQQEDGSYSLSFSGTGTFITSQGDILTADHVINPPKGQDLDASLYNAAANDIAKYMNQNPKQGGSQVTKEQVLQQLTSGQLKGTTAYDKPSSTAFLSTDYTGPLTAPDLQNLPDGIALNVDQIRQESAPEQQDMAIIHVPMQDTPSVPLASGEGVQIQDTLTIIGFPGNGDVSNRPGDLLTSSTNVLQVSSKKNNESGAPLIQVAGNAGHGDSGAPALNSDGQIVGIVSFKQADPDNSGGNATFLQASQSAQAMIDQLGLDTTPGTFQQLWNQAFQDYAATTPGHWGKAQQGFEQLTQQYPLFKAVQPYLDYARDQAQNEATATPTATPTPTVGPTATTAVDQPQNKPSQNIPVSFPMAALVIGGVVLVIALAGCLFWVIVRPKGKKKPPTNGVAALNEQKDERGSTEATSEQSAPGGATLPASAQPQHGGQQTLALKIWPCGHMNRPGARFCSICGEAAPIDGPGSSTIH